MDVTVHAPEKKHNSFVAKLSTTAQTAGRPGSSRAGSHQQHQQHKIKIKIRLVDIKIIHVAPLKNSEGSYIMKVLLPDDLPEVQRIVDIDDCVIRETKLHNASWFKNSLDDDTIDAMFRRSLHPDKRVLTVLLSDTKDPSIYLDGKLVEGTDALYVSLKDRSMCADSKVDVDIEAQGLCFYPQKFGVRWMISRLGITKLGSHTDMDALHLDIDKCAIEQCWEEDVADLSDRIDQDIAVLTARIDKLKDDKRAVQDDLAVARQTTSCNDPCWHEHLQSLLVRCKSYYNGSSG